MGTPESWEDSCQAALGGLGFGRGWDPSSEHVSAQGVLGGCGRPLDVQGKAGSHGAWAWSSILKRGCRCPFQLGQPGAEGPGIRTLGREGSGPGCQGAERL